MKKKFIVGITLSSDEKLEALKKYVKSKNYAFWSWIQNFWLIIDPEGEQSALGLQRDLAEIVPEGNIIVFEVGDGLPWAGLGPKSEKHNMFRWLHDSWGKS